MEWKVTYQSTPYNFTDPQVLIVAGDSKEQALVTAYDQLTRQGHAINVDSVVYDLRGDSIDWAAAQALGWPQQQFSVGSVHIRSLQPHGVRKEHVNAAQGKAGDVTRHNVTQLLAAAFVDRVSKTGLRGNIARSKAALEFFVGAAVAYNVAGLTDLAEAVRVALSFDIGLRGYKAVEEVAHPAGCDCRHCAPEPEEQPEPVGYATEEEAARQARVAAAYKGGTWYVVRTTEGRFREVAADQYDDTAEDADVLIARYDKTRHGVAEQDIHNS